MPSSIEKRLASISADQSEFDKAKPQYEQALKNSGLPHALKYSPTPPSPSFRAPRTRNVIWYNPPFNSAVKQNLGKQFLNLIDKHFPPQHKFHSFCNRNSIKLSYSCMPNMKSIISAHNKKLLQQFRQPSEPTPEPRNCNCRKPDECPLNGQCLERTVVYQATVKTDDGLEKLYTGLTDLTFKERFNGHTASFRNLDQRNSTALSQYIWQLKDERKNHSISWKILKRCQTYKCGTRNCDLCTAEKVYILMSDPKSSLNKRSELISKCRHRKKFKLEGVT